MLLTMAYLVQHYHQVGRIALRLGGFGMGEKDFQTPYETISARSSQKEPKKDNAPLESPMPYRTERQSWAARETWSSSCEMQKKDTEKSWEKGGAKFDWKVPL
jgi:hypothetical protein